MAPTRGVESFTITNPLKRVPANGKASQSSGAEIGDNHVLQNNEEDEDPALRASIEKRKSMEVLQSIEDHDIEELEELHRCIKTKRLKAERALELRKKIE